MLKSLIHTPPAISYEYYSASTNPIASAFLNVKYLLLYRRLDKPIVDDEATETPILEAMEGACITSAVDDYPAEV
jgi:hypothetical protein